MSGKTPEEIRANIAELEDRLSIRYLKYQSKPTKYNLVQYNNIKIGIKFWQNELNLLNKKEYNE